jgi:hypothetical protein
MSTEVDNRWRNPLEAEGNVMVRKRPIRLVALLGLALLVAVAIYGFAAANTVPATKAGDGSGAISGYTASSVIYTLNSSDPSKIDKVAFTLNPTSTTTVKAKLVSAGTDWYSCTNTAGSVECVTTSPQATVASADQLQVVAVG